MKERKFCSVCHQLGDSFHFGAVSCKACAAFFRRITSMNLSKKYVCRKQNNCLIKMSTRDNCKACRYQKCLAVGMNPDSVRLPEEAPQPQSQDIIVIESYMTSTSYSRRSSVSQSSLVSSSSASSSILNFELDESAMPMLTSVLEGYQKLCRKRYEMHDTKMDPKPCNHFDFCQLYVRDIHLQNDFLENSFPEYKIMAFDEKKKVFRNFFTTFLILEMAFKTYLEGVDMNTFILANGDYIDVMQLDQYYMDPNKKWKCKPEEAVRMYQPAFEQIQRNVYLPVFHQKLNLVEFLALATLCTWNEGVDGNPASYYRNCQPIRQKVISDLLNYYQKDGTTPDPLMRLSSILLILPQLERSIQLFIEHVEIQSVFQCFALHNKLYNIISEV